MPSRLITAAPILPIGIIGWVVFRGLYKPVVPGSISGTLYVWTTSRRCVNLIIIVSVFKPSYCLWTRRHTHVRCKWDFNACSYKRYGDLCSCDVHILSCNLVSCGGNLISRRSVSHLETIWHVGPVSRFEVNRPWFIIDKLFNDLVSMESVNDFPLSCDSETKLFTF